MQYLAWLGHARRGDFGHSYLQRRPVTEILAGRFPRSLELAFLTLVVAVLWAVPTQDRAMVTVDPGDLFSVVSTTDAGSNWGKWSDKKTDELTQQQGLRETNRDKRKQIHWELQRHLLSGAPSAIPVAWVEGFHFVDKRVRGDKFAPTVYDHHTFMKVWLAR